MEKTAFSSSFSDVALSIDLNSKPMHNPSENIPPLDLIHELHRTRLENKKLHEALAIIRRDYDDFIDQIQTHQTQNKKIKLHQDYDCVNLSSNVSTIHVRIDPSDTGLVVKDGHKWKKYGQKLTRGNSSPRAYYKCSMARTNCPVKKKVQKSPDDPSLLVATYQGHHNHSPSSRPNIASPDFTDPAVFDKVQSTAIANSTEIQQFLVGKMASSLMENRTFTAALAAAIKGKILEDNNDDFATFATKSRVYSM